MVKAAPITISKLSPEMRSTLRPLLQQSWAESYESELGEQITAKMIKSLVSEDIGGLVPNKDELVFIAMQDDHIQGCAISAARHDITYLWGFYVLANLHRQGIGRSLLHHSVAAFRASKSVQLTVLGSSIGAISFYQDLGFTAQSKSEFEIVPGHLVESITMTAPTSKFIQSL